MNAKLQGPTFIGIGAQKAGTSWLDRVLRSYPDIWMPPVKELHYFDLRDTAFPATAWGKYHTRLGGGRHWRSELRNRVKAGLRYLDLGDARWSANYLFGERDDAWYRSLFTPAQGRVSGEITPEYSLLGDEAVLRLAREYPQLKAVFLVREPVSRCWSHGRMDMLRADSTCAADAISADINGFFAASHCLQRSDYVAIIDRWSVAFGDRFLWAFSEDIGQQPAEFVTRLRDFLGLPLRLPDDPSVLHSRIGVGKPRDIPTDLAQALHQHFRPKVVEMRKRFGRVPAAWLEAHGLKADGDS